MRPKKTVFLNKGTPVDLKQESKKMEDKLNQLKSLIQKQKQERNTTERFITTKQKTRATGKVLYPEISQFLNELGYSQYYDVFVNNGIDSMEILVEVKKEELEEIGVLKGHAIKIIKQLKSEKEQTVTNSKLAVDVPKAQTVVATSDTKGMDQTKSAFSKKPNTAIKEEPKKTYSTFEGCQEGESYTVSLKPRAFCQKCYRQHQVNELKGFCSQKCKILFEQQNFVRCQRCGNRSERWECHKLDDGFLCSDKCLNELISELEQQEKMREGMEGEGEEELYWSQEERGSGKIDIGEVDQISRMLQNLQ